MYQYNPLIEAFIVKNPGGRVFHKGQIKQTSYAIKQARVIKNSLELKLSKINDSISMLQKKMAISSPLKVKELQLRINSLITKKSSISKLINVQNGIIKNQQNQIKRMAAVNKKVGATMN